MHKIKLLIQQGAYRVTRTAFADAAADFGFIQPLQIVNIVLSLDHTDFYKSMTTYHDNNLWQDVYRPTINDTKGYVKIRIVDDNTVIISFKRQ